MKAIQEKKLAGIAKESFSEDDVIEYEEAAQCQICDKEFADNRQSMKCLDHDHETGHYRGTICGACNTGLGKTGRQSSRDSRKSIPLLCYIQSSRGINRRLT